MNKKKMKRNSEIFSRNFELQRCYKSDIAQKPDIERCSLTYKNGAVSLACCANKTKNALAHSLQHDPKHVYAVHKTMKRGTVPKQHMYGAINERYYI